MLALTLVPTRSLMAQIESATVSGLVLDSSGLPIAAAVVAARETTTNVSRETVTNAAGLYTLPFLKPGSYEIRVNKANFKQATATLTVQVNQSARLDFSLEVGRIDEVVTIFASESLIQMENMAVGGDIRENY
jgi:protocatechuate 3,4-dioxygenase beta subunit